MPAAGASSSLARARERDGGEGCVVDLTSGDAHARVATTGGEWRGWRCGGRELFWSGDARWWARQCPLLFPLVGRLHRGVARFGGREQAMPVHGFGAAARFAVVERAADRLALGWESDAATRAVYPFDFALRLHYLLAPRSFTVAFELRNTGQAALPWSLGWHPGFALPLDGGAWQRGASVRFAAAESAQVPVIRPDGLFAAAARTLPLHEGRTLPLRPELFADEALCFLNAHSRSVSLQAGDGSAIDIEADGFAHWALWQPPGAPLLCIESWTGHGDAEDYEGEFTERPSTSHLAPGATARLRLRYRWRGKSKPRRVRARGGLMTPRIGIAAAGPDRLGECPLWHPLEQRLYWVDAFAPAIRRLDPASGAVESFALPFDIGSFVFCPDGTLVAGTRAGFQHIRLEEGQAHCKLLADPLAHDRRLMLNDGKCDRRGRYWCASVHSDFIGRAAELYRFDAPSGAVRIDGGFIIGNGIAFSPDDRRMYLADSRDEIVWVYDLDLERGTLADKRRFFSTRDIAGRVEGATSDREGNYWCALVHGAAVACISPAGRLLERITVPVKHPTMVAFGGPQLDTLYVTSATVRLDAGERAAWPQAGALFRIDGLRARGLPEPLFDLSAARSSPAEPPPSSSSPGPPS
ncbi:MAG: SMP-30/gluconolactonase/LRE family protein [Rubrivivax sp.]